MSGVGDVIEVVNALRAPRRLACGLHCREQERDEYGDDRNDHQ
jgi:hypothetical protein